MPMLHHLPLVVLQEQPILSGLDAASAGGYAICLLAGMFSKSRWAERVSKLREAKRELKEPSPKV